MADTLIESVVWRRVEDDASFERANLLHTRGGYALSGRVIVAEQGWPLEASYRLDCSDDGARQGVTLQLAWGGDTHELRLAREPGGWSVAGVARPDLRDCTDIDLGLSPSTNLLPIRRLGLAIGAGAEIRAAWVRFPGLEVVAARQRYDRLAERRWRYTGIDSQFVAEIEVDEHGLPIDYGSIWKRIAEWRP